VVTSADPAGGVTLKQQTASSGVARRGASVALGCSGNGPSGAARSVASITRLIGPLHR